MKQIQRETLETHNAMTLTNLHLKSNRGLVALLKDYTSYNSGLGCYDEMIKAVRVEMKKRAL